MYLVRFLYYAEALGLHWGSARARGGLGQWLGAFIFGQSLIAGHRLGVASNWWFLVRGNHSGFKSFLLEKEALG